MERGIYDETARIEDAHWWFLGRRSIVQSLLGGIALPPQATLMEAGCGSGGNLAMFAEKGNVFGFELDTDSLSRAQQRHIGQVEAGSLPGGIPFPGQSFDLIAMLDVLEHVEEDEASLRALQARLNPGGRLLLTVPAFMALWSHHDIEHHHKRRYTLGELKRKVEAAGFTVEKASYINFWLFPAVYAVRWLERRKPPAAGQASGGMQVPPRFVNGLLYRLFASERFLLPYTELPFGVSVILVARKR